MMSLSELNNQFMRQIRYHFLDSKGNSVYLSSGDTEKILLDRYPNYFWIYDKYQLSQRLGQYVVDLETQFPERFPVLVKPKINLLGMGIGCHKVHHLEQIQNRKGFIAQEFYEGVHISTDMVLIAGQVVDKFSFKCHVNEYGGFDYFESISDLDSTDGSFAVAELLKDYTGLLCVETIGGKVIEAHLRAATMFYDICGGFIEKAYQQVIYNKVSQEDYETSSFEKTYSKFNRRLTDAYPQLAKLKIECPNGVRSFHLEWEPGYKLSDYAQDPNTFRYLVVNGTDLKQIESFSNWLTNQIQFQECL